ncbi:MAG TPA: tripartite tricarboxylate transporter substrate binding protein [Amaricoccus sp.]|uniref:tripartite tricarboxylate transporter substrate binding protein n=1 Tax=Amaricoccus sp. TaxID=1872485 RepID=UPI002BF6C6B0|nr:tripartite tricarboxylate transporter substrate binding protein [Amaricoccus sp.]HMR34231.1 tripartite tricarboxylate transporter substrate binding protein [Geminicoccus sp.]HMU00775.1 tripartite tricarboxylate transporter substrate binding protein [Amaricoccus sp.]
MKLFRFVGLLAALALATLSAPASAQNASKFPEKPVTLVVAFGAGGGSDLLSRTIASTITKYLGQPLIVDLQPGGGGTIATTQFAKSAKPDGYTLLVVGTGATTSVPHSRQVEYHPIDDFDFVIGITLSTQLLAVRADFPANTVQEFIEYAKANPGTVKLAHTGVGGEDWAMVQLLAKGIGTTFIDVPFDGGGTSATAAAGGHVDGVIGSLAGVMPFVEAGKLKMLALVNSERSKSLPDIPTFKELGYTDVVLDTRLGIAAPKGTPPEILQKLHDAFKANLEDPSFITLMSRIGLDINYVGLTDYRDALKGAYERMGTVIPRQQ